MPPPSSGGGTSSCAGGKGKAHWAPRQPRAPPLTSSSGVRSLGSRAPPPWLTWLRPCVSPAPRSLHPAQRRRPLSAPKPGPGRWRLKGTGAGATGAGRAPLSRCALPRALAPPLPRPAQPPGCDTPFPAVAKASHLQPGPALSSRPHYASHLRMPLSLRLLILLCISGSAVLPLNSFSLGFSLRRHLSAPFSSCYPPLKPVFEILSPQVITTTPPTPAPHIAK